MERARAFAPPAGRSRGECGSGIALTRSPARPKIGAVHRGGVRHQDHQALGSRTAGQATRSCRCIRVGADSSWRKRVRSVPAHVPDSVRIGSEPVAVQVLQRAVQGTGRRNAQVWSGAHPPARARSASLSRFGGTATRSMFVERRKRAAYLGGESALATPRRGCARAVGGYFERDLVHPVCSRACSPSEASCGQGSA
jgi:hypothetical protein